MKGNVILSLAAAGSLVAAQPHQHNHQHLHKRAPAPAATEVVTVGGPTVYKFVLDGEEISNDKACGGLDDGKYLLESGTAPSGACPTSSSAPAPAQFFEKPTVSVPSVSVPTISIAPSSSSAPPPPPSSSSSAPAAPSSSQGPTHGGAGADQDFPDGELDCSHFPADYGAISLDYLGLGGWSGIQRVAGDGTSYSSIDTAIEGDTCEDGSMCSYACAPGFQKSQWPAIQGNTGQSVGGLKCSGGKLWLTNPKLSKKLCISGTGNVAAQNKLQQSVAVCRTDYPGTESETVPVTVGPNGDTQPLTCPNSATYYSWTNKPTTAQYYVNPAGVPASEACQWGDGSRAIGNWAPVNLGIGTNAIGETYISISQNKPTTYENLNFKIEIVGDISGPCRYENGMYHSDIGSNEDGCTVRVLSGQATYVFS